jgi:hypothetical protein
MTSPFSVSRQNDHSILGNISSSKRYILGFKRIVSAIKRACATSGPDLSELKEHTLKRKTKYHADVISKYMYYGTFHT